VAPVRTFRTCVDGDEISVDVRGALAHPS
jgi:hypothetical protein